MQEHAEALSEAIEAALPGWVRRSVERVMAASGQSFDAVTEARTAEAAERARRDAGARIRELLDADIDEQVTTPLSILRDAVRYPTDVLHRAGIPPVERDDFARESFPDDDYDLTPASFADIDPSIVEPGIAWGAAKAWTHKQRHNR